jgi:WD40 repeat protein
VGRAPAGHAGGVNAIARFTDRNRPDVLTAGADGTVRLWDTASGRQQLTGLRAATGLKALCVLEDGHRQRIAAASYAGVIHVQAADDDRSRLEFATHTGTINALATIRHGRRLYLAGGGQDGALWCWDPASGRRASMRKRRQQLHAGPINALTTISTADGDMLVAGADRTLQVVDPETLSVLRTFTGHAREIRSITRFSLGGTQFLATGSADRTVRMWDTQTGRDIAAFVGHTGTVNVVTSVDLGGRTYLVSGSSDRTLRVWDPATEATVISVPVYHPVLDCTSVGYTIAAALSAGVLTIDLRLAGA